MICEMETPFVRGLWRVDSGNRIGLSLLAHKQVYLPFYAPFQSSCKPHDSIHSRTLLIPFVQKKCILCALLSALVLAHVGIALWLSPLGIGCVSGMAFDHVPFLVIFVEIFLVFF